MTAPTQVVPGVVDVVVIAPAPGRREAIAVPAPGRSRVIQPWQVLTLQRGPNTRCTGAWEIVHGRIEPGERPEQAAVRELFEETGLTATRLYNVTVNAFYLHHSVTVQLAIVFAAVVDAATPVALGAEHATSKWVSVAKASRTLAWPREREALAHVQQLLRYGDAGPVEDVLRVF